MVGIFWLFEGRLIIDASPLSRAAPYRHALPLLRFLGGAIQSTKVFIGASHSAADDLLPEALAEEPAEARAAHGSGVERSTC